MNFYYYFDKRIRVHIFESMSERIERGMWWDGDVLVGDEMAYINLFVNWNITNGRFILYMHR